MRKRDIIYLENNLRTSIINDVRNIAIYHSRGHKGIEAGFFSIPRQVFCYVDYLGSIAFSGKSSTKRAENFIRKYFPPIYHPFAELIYAMWRHGTVHRYEPISYYIDLSGSSPKRISIKWLSNNSNKKLNRNENMKIYQRGNNDADLYLVVNTCQLVDNLISALDSFILEMKTDEKYRKDCEARLNRFGVVEEYTVIQRPRSRDAVRKQILIAWKERAGEIDHKGHVIRRYNQEKGG